MHAQLTSPTYSILLQIIYYQKLVEDYEKRYIAQEEKISTLNSAIRQSSESATNKIRILEVEKEGLIQSNQKVSREVARLLDVDINLQNSEKQIESYKLKLHKAEKEIEKCKLELRKAEEELQTKEFMVSAVILLIF